VDVEVVIESAVKSGFDNEMVHAALIDVDLNALDDFATQLGPTYYNSLKREVIKHLVKLVENTSSEEKAIHLLGCALEVSHPEIDSAITALGKFKNEKAFKLIRKVAVQGWTETNQHAAQVIIDAQYDGSAVRALADDLDVIRRASVLQLEKQNDIQELLGALNNDCVMVRRVAAWYMGRKLVQEAVSPLTLLAQKESDIETLRAAIWSLGVLRNVEALPTMEKLTEHSNPLIKTTAREAMTRIIR
jgi:HEAT repeat protein